MIMALWTHAGVAAWARALGRSHWAPVVGPLFFFSASFAWGFGPTMMGLGPALLALAGCTRLYARPNGPVACTTALWACLAVAAHGVYLPSMLLGALPLALMGGRSAWLCAALTVLGASVPVWPMVWAASPSGAPLALPEVTFETLSTGWNHLRLYFAAFDRGLCRAAHQLLTLGCAVVVVGRCRRFTAPERWVLLLALAHLSLLWLVPLNIALTPTPAWLLNVRFVTLFDVALCLLALPRHKTAAPMTLGAVSLCVALFLGGMARIFSQFHQAALYVDVLAETVPPNTCLPPVGAPLKFADAWPPLGRHLTSALVPHPVCAHGNVFVGGHFPLTPKLTCTHPEVYLGPP
jgi:hypothetical protein